MLSNPTDEQSKEVEVENDSPYFKANMNNLVLNITDIKGNLKLIKLSFSIKSKNPLIESKIEELKPEITDSLITLISHSQSESLLTNQGKKLFKVAMIKSINEIENKDNLNLVENVYFAEFIIK